MTRSPPDPLQGLRAFVPVHAQWRLEDDGAIAANVHRDVIEAAALCVDVNGWTTLVRRACSRPETAAETADAIAAATGILVDAIAAEGGDVIHLCAGRLVALWRDETYAMAVARATSGALTVLQRCTDASATAGIKLAARATVSAGDVALNTVGGGGGRWLCALTGTAIAELVDPAQRARDGDVLLRASAAAHVGDIIRGDWLPGGAMRVTELHPRPRREALHGPTMVAGDAGSLLQLVHPTVAEAAQAASDPTVQAAESTVIALRIADLDPEADVAELQRVVVDIQRQTQRLGATVLRLRFEADGGYLVAELPATQANDHAARGVRVARSLVALLSPARSCSAAVATGPAMRLVVGSRARRSFTSLGGLARRAIAMTRADEGTLVDATTARAAAPYFDFDAGADLRIGGVLERYTMHRCGGRRAVPDDVDAWRPGFAVRATEEGGEQDAAETIRTQLHAHATVAVGYCAFADRFTPFGAWRRLARSWLGTDPPTANVAEVTAWWLRTLRDATALRPVVLLFTNGVAMDSASWQLARSICGWLDELQVVVTGPADTPDGPRAWHRDPRELTEVAARWRRVAAAGHPHPGDPQTWPDVADKALAGGATEEAVELLRASIDRHERAGARAELADAAIQLADALQTLGRSDESVAVCRTALDALGAIPDPSHGTPRRLLRITDRLTKIGSTAAARREQALTAALQERVATKQDLTQPSQGRP